MVDSQRIEDALAVGEPREDHYEQVGLTEAEVAHRVDAGRVNVTTQAPSRSVEEIVSGSAKDEETAALAGKSAVRGAAPLNYNHFKAPLMENLVKRALRA